MRRGLSSSTRPIRHGLRGIQSTDEGGAGGGLVMDSGCRGPTDESYKLNKC